MQSPVREGRAVFDATSVRCRAVTETTICRIFLILPLSRDEDPTGSGGILDALRCHGAAAFRATATNFGAARHLRVVHGVACIGALAADLRAGTANHVVNAGRSEEHTSELQSLMRISYAVFCLKKKNTKQQESTN